LLFALYLPVMEKIYRRIYCYEMGFGRIWR
jgi:hypothetical protein